VRSVIGAILWNWLSGQREDTETDQSHASKLDYPADANQQASITALARAHIALAKDIDTAEKRQSAHDKRTHSISFWTAIGVGTYTVITFILMIVTIIQYGQTRIFNKKQIRFLSGQLAEMKSGSAQTGTLIASNQKLADAASKEAAADVASVRALLLVYPRGFAINITHPLPFGPTRLNRSIYYTIHNYGPSPGIIEAMNPVAEIRAEPPTRRELDNIEPRHNNVVGIIAVTASQDSNSRLPEVYDFFLSDGDLAALQRGERRLFFYGTIRYTDILGNNHTTGWTTEYLPDSSGFRTIGDQDVNYQN
jgi:hypothetical protein